MSFLSGVARAATGLLGLGVGALFSKRKREPRQRQVTRDDAAREAAQADALARRRGAAADRVTGASGEPAGGFGNLIRGS